MNNMWKKIIKARELMNDPELKNNIELLLNLKDITDKAELLYNDMKIKKYKCKEAAERTEQIEKLLDDILTQAEREFSITEHNISLKFQKK